MQPKYSELFARLLKTFHLTKFVEEGFHVKLDHYHFLEFLGNPPSIAEDLIFCQFNFHGVWKSSFPLYRKLKVFCGICPRVYWLYNSISNISKSVSVLVHWLLLRSWLCCPFQLKAQSSCKPACFGRVGFLLLDRKLEAFPSEKGWKLSCVNWGNCSIIYRNRWIRICII